MREQTVVIILTYATLALCLIFARWRWRSRKTAHLLSWVLPVVVPMMALFWVLWARCLYSPVPNLLVGAAVYLGLIMVLVIGNYSRGKGSRPEL